MSKFENLTKYLPQLGDDNFGTWIIDRENDGTPEHPIQMPFVNYTELVHNFIDDVMRIVDQEPEMQLTHYGKILERNGIEWGSMSMSEMDISKADVTCVLALLVGAVRAERFCDGALLGFFRDGSIHKWLERLKEIDEAAKLYDCFKARIKSHALYAKYAALELKNRKCAEYIFGVETTDDELYQKVIWKIEESAQRQVEWLFVQLCMKYGYPVAAPDRNSKCTCDHDILFEKGDKIIQVDFKSVLRPSDLFINRPKSKNKRPRRAPIRETDTYLVYLLKKNEEGYTWLEQRTSSDDLAKAVLVSDFISEVFGEEEGMRFDVAMSCFSEDMRDALGYRITQIGTEQALKELRNTLAVELPDYGYDAIRHFNDKAAKKKVYVTDSVFQEMSQRFATNYKVLVGNSDFAISLLTSEWLYRQYGTIPGLDNTYVVTGYCKSIEQLLWRIISVVGKGRKIGLSNSEVGDNTSASDTTLGALKYFLNATKNADLFNKIFGDNTFYVQRYLNYQLSEWIEHERNGNFHKHNLTPERVGIIREQTLYLYFLILGSLTLTNDTIALLME